MPRKFSSKHLERWWSQVTRLSNSGQLKDATASMLTALGRQARAAADHHDHGVDAKGGAGPASAARHADGSSVSGDQFIDGHHAERAGTRDYKLYIPPGPTQQARPLIVMLHGCTQHPDDFAAGTGMNESARREGFYVLYPAQSRMANPSRCWNWFKHNHQQRDRGEPAILAGMVQAVMHQYGIDPKRVYVAGLSAGGAMADILGHAYPDVFAAIGVHSGLPMGAASGATAAFSAMKGQGSMPPGRLTNAPPVIVFHGDQDDTVHPLNGERVVALHPQAGQGLSERATSPNGRSATRTSHRNPAGHVVVEHWLVHGSGHAWSGGNKAGSYTDPQGPSATEIMLAFFKSHQRRESV